MAAGVFASYPPEDRSSSDTCFVIEADRKTAIDAPCRPSSFSFSRSGTGVLPSILVIIMLWDMPGRVYSTPRAAAAAVKLDTPGTISIPEAPKI